MAIINIPSRLVAGDTLRFEAALSDYPADSGWTMTVIIITENARYTLNSTASGSNHLVDVAATATVKWRPATYRYTAFVERAGERYTVDQGIIEVAPDFVTTSSTDLRNHVEKVLAAIEATLEKKASRDQMEISFQGRQLKHLQPSELLAWRDKYRAELVSLRKQAAIEQGQTHGGLIKVRFN